MARSPFIAGPGPSYAPPPAPPMDDGEDEDVPGYGPGSRRYVDEDSGKVTIIVPGAMQEVYDPATGTRKMIQGPPKTYAGGTARRRPAAGSGGGGRVGRDPTLAALDQLRLEAAQRAAANADEDRARDEESRQAGLDIARGNLGVSQGNLGVNQGNLALQQLIAAEGSWAQKAADAVARGSLAEAIEARKMQNLFSQRRADLEDKDFGLRSELGYADSRRSDMNSNINRANVFGQDIDGNATGTVGMLTAGEQQRRFGNANLIGQQTLQQGNLEQARKTQQEQWLAGLRMQQEGQAFAQRQAENQDVRSDLALKIQMANQRARGGGTGGRIVARPSRGF